ncbi:PQQ-dependent sugar dehydrogenase [Aerosticca soli]|uniref:Glucose/sorbosone dehydrogenases n=1 Tax=Aerosticca soli TaxID=2010829 RepID=A0A2Z6E297_9GAMM|nr:PQQ-dependent sugar dehydrogenase [Aerosticca soli]BBD78709.1 glucose/sorbosone dehydrogenases [Aerosticca soli]
MRCKPHALFAGVCLLLAHVAAAGVPTGLALPPGFGLTVYAESVPGAREMAQGAQGTVFVGSTKGEVYALTDADHNGVAERVRVIARGLQLPVGVAFHDGDLYVSAVSRIYVLRDIERHLDDPPAPELVTDRLPGETHHGWKFIAFGPDGALYVPIGAPCNICDPGPDHGKLIRMRPDGSGWQDVALGIRNTVGFDWQPETGRLWFTDNGRDLMGDDLPSDELDRIDRPGQHFGYPYCHQGDTPDPEFGRGKDCRDYTPPVLKLGAHVAALGMRFYTGTRFPPRYRGAIFIAEHGSWNRTRKAGYQVVVVRFEHGRALPPEPFLIGFVREEKALGRPADVLVLGDGSLLVSDDLTGAIYRIDYRP